jgi:hypothetical protein
MEERPDSMAKSFGRYLGFLAAFIPTFFLYIWLEDRPFGIQIATTITYTGVVSLYVFTGWGKRLNLRAVQQDSPLLLTIHIAYLVFVFGLLTFSLALRPHLPSYWLTEHGRNHETWFSDLLVLIGVLTATSQILISRRILNRSLTNM